MTEAEAQRFYPTRMDELGFEALAPIGTGEQPAARQVLTDRQVQESEQILASLGDQPQALEDQRARRLEFELGVRLLERCADDRVESCTVGDAARGGRQELCSDRLLQGRRQLPVEPRIAARGPGERIVDSCPVEIAAPPATVREGGIDAAGGERRDGREKQEWIADQLAEGRLAAEQLRDCGRDRLAAGRRIPWRRSKAASQNSAKSIVARGESGASSSCSKLSAERIGVAW